MIGLSQLLQAAPAAKLRAAQYVQPLNSAMAAYKINTPMRQAAFLAQIFHESGNLTCVEENLNYGAAGLSATWPTRFNTSEAAAYARKPEMIANKVYASRMGNGNEASGDGWKHRGAGLIQLTGKDNQYAFAMDADRDILTIGDYLRTTEGACLSAAWYWDRGNLNAYADNGNIDAISDLINIGRRTEKVGDAIGYSDRLKLYNAFKKALGA